MGMVFGYKVVRREGSLRYGIMLGRLLLLGQWRDGDRSTERPHSHGWWDSYRDPVLYMAWLGHGCIFISTGKGQ